MCIECITSCSIIKYLKTMHHEKIDLDKEVEDKVEKDLEDEKVK
jgi:hypothetical protein